jgi:hypothetical protein
MHFTTAIGLAGLAGFATAMPTVERAVAAEHPASNRSSGFTLVVNVTDLAKDFTPPIHLSYIASIHTGAGEALVGITPNETIGRLFYQNGTETQVKENKTNILTDGGTPPTPQGFQLYPDGPSQAESETVSYGALNFGPGNPGIFIPSTPKEYAYVLPETFVACNESLAYYSGRYFITIKHVNATTDAQGVKTTKIPEACIAVRLIPQCATLNVLPADAFASHEYAVETTCYNDVASINWQKTHGA